MVTYQPVSEYQTLVGRNGSTVQFGNMLILPFDNSLLYMRPVYAKEEQSGRYTLQRIIVASGERTGFGETLEGAISDLFQTDEQGDPIDGADPPQSTTTTPPDGSTSTTTAAAGLARRRPTCSPRRTSCSATQNRTFVPTATSGRTRTRCNRPRT